MKGRRELLEAPHRKLYDSVPAAFSRIYRTLDEGALRRLPASAAEAALVDRFSAGEHSFAAAQARPHRIHHGRVRRQPPAAPSHAWRQLRGAERRGAPGAGTARAARRSGRGDGVLSAVLKHRDVDVLAYDAAPPTAENANGFFDTQFTEVLQADASALFRQQPSWHVRGRC